MPALSDTLGEPLDRLVNEIKASAKYRHVCEDLVRNLGAQEMHKRPDNEREMVKAVKNKLHQIGGAYLDHTPNYAAWLNDLQAALPSHTEAFRATCRRMMQLHASTRERLPILESFYAEVFAALPPIHSVLDVACGFNPLALPWMPLAPQASYTAIDIYEDLMTFLEQSITLCGMKPQTIAHSVLSDFPALPPCDLALVLKAVPCLEQVDKAAGTRLLEQIKARYMLVSFPIHSLGGKSKGMATNYETHFNALVGDKPWAVQKFRFDTELAFLVTKQK